MLRNIALGVIVGSLRRGSYSRKVAKALMARLPVGWSATLIEIGDLPLYNEDLDEAPPQQWTAFRDAVAACDALLFVTPEYNRSVPGVLKNATDVGSRPEGKNVFAGLPAGVVSVSPYPAGAMAANHALRQSFVYLDLAVMQQPEAYVRGADELFRKDGSIADAEADKLLADFMRALGKWVDRVGTSSEDFEAFMRRREDASLAYIGGNAAPLLALSTRNDPATFFPPSGERVVGADAVNAANTKGAKAFAAGSKGRFEVLATAAGDDLAYWTGVQHADARMAGKDERVSMQLRTTEIFRNEGGDWKLIHRHADMIEDKELG